MPARQLTRPLATPRPCMKRKPEPSMTTSSSDSRMVPSMPERMVCPPGRRKEPLSDLGDAFEPRSIEGAEHLDDPGGAPCRLPLGGEEPQQKRVQGAGGVAVDRTVGTDAPTQEDAVVAVAEIEVFDLEPVGRQVEMGRTEELDGIVLEMQVEFVDGGGDHGRRARRPVDVDVDGGVPTRGMPDSGNTRARRFSAEVSGEVAASGEVAVGGAAEFDRTIDSVGQAAANDPRVGLRADVDLTGRGHRIELPVGRPSGMSRPARRTSCRVPDGA